MAAFSVYRSRLPARAKGKVSRRQFSVVADPAESRLEEKALFK